MDGTWIRSASYRDAVEFAVARSDVCIMSGIFWNYTRLVAARACKRHGVPYITMPRGLLRPWAQHKGRKKRAYWALLGRRAVKSSSALIALACQELDVIRAVHLAVPAHIVLNGAFVEAMSDADVDRQWAETDDEPYIRCPILLSVCSTWVRLRSRHIFWQALVRTSHVSVASCASPASTNCRSCGAFLWEI